MSRRWQISFLLVRGDHCVGDIILISLIDNPNNSHIEAVVVVIVINKNDKNTTLSSVLTETYDTVLPTANYFCINSCSTSWRMVAEYISSFLLVTSLYLDIPHFNSKYNLKCWIVQIQVINVVYI